MRLPPPLPAHHRLRRVGGWRSPVRHCTRAPRVRCFGRRRGSAKRGITPYLFDRGAAFNEVLRRAGGQPRLRCVAALTAMQAPCPAYEAAPPISRS